MEPDIADAAWCLCSMPWPAPRSGEIGIFVRSSEDDPDGGGHFTVDRVGGALKPRNPSFAPIAPRGDDSERPFARFLRVLAFP
jgi:hypothetical protein